MSHPGVGMSAGDRIGPHLLGRNPRAPDTTDWKMGHALTTGYAERDFSSFEDRTLRDLKGDTTFVRVWTDILALWRWLKSEWASPATPDGLVDGLWKLASILDQGQTGHCVGFGGTGWMNAFPLDNRLSNDYGHALYYACKEVEGEPLQENGSTVHALAKVLKARGLIGSYVWASTVEEIRQWIRERGPVVLGTWWTEDMYNPSPEGFVTPTGKDDGGHCFVGIGDRGDDIWFANSWSPRWGLQGFFKMNVGQFEKLWYRPWNEAMAGIELRPAA